MSKLDRSKCVTVEWKIVNFSHINEEKFNLKGHVFKTETKRCNTLWYTYLTQYLTEGEGQSSDDCGSATHSSPPEYEISLGLWDITEKSSELECKVFILSTDGEIELPVVPMYHFYSRKRMLYYTLKRHEILGNPSLLSQDTLNIHYRFFGKELIKEERFMFQTVLHQVNFLWQTKEFKFDDNYLQNTLHEHDTLQVILSLFSDKVRGSHEVSLETYPNKQGFPTIVTAELSIKDDSGQCIEPTTATTTDHFKPTTTDHFCSTKVWVIDIDEKSDTISSLQFRLKSLVAVSMECPTLSDQDLQPDSGSTTAEANLLLYRDKLNSDATLNAGGKLFPVHQKILSARSQVFRKMFKPYHPILWIPDVDSETLERLLVYLYSDTLEDVQWVQALALYRAARIYAVPSLKSRCADILKQGLAAENFRKILLLAEEYADEDLMRCTVDFIHDNREVVSSEEWDKLEDFNLRLAAKITRELCLKCKSEVNRDIGLTKEGK